MGNDVAYNIMNTFKTFPAKILLFGEHIINKGANGLALPFHKYNCTLSFEKTAKTLTESKEVLSLIHNQIENDEILDARFDNVEFLQDIETENLVMKSIMKFKKDITIIMISHNANTLKFFKKIINLDNL